MRLLWSASLSQQQPLLAVPTVAPCDQTLRMASQLGQPVDNPLRYQANIGTAALRDAFGDLDLRKCSLAVTRGVVSCGTQAGRCRVLSDVPVDRAEGAG
jgi:hypothetical protein